MGRIGQGIAKRGAHGFGMKVVYHNRSRLSPELEAECKAGYVGKDELLAMADHVVLVLPYTKENHHTIGAAEGFFHSPAAGLYLLAGTTLLAAALVLGVRARLAPALAAPSAA